MPSHYFQFSAPARRVLSDLIWSIGHPTSYLFHPRKSHRRTQHRWYNQSMSTITLEKPIVQPKVRRTFTLDADIVDALATIDPDNLSGAVNTALRYALDRQAKRASLVTLAADLDAQFGHPDQAEIDHAVALLS